MSFSSHALHGNHAKINVSDHPVYGGCSEHELTFVKCFVLDQLLFLFSHFADIFHKNSRTSTVQSAKTLTTKHVQPPYENETNYITKHLKSLSPSPKSLVSRIFTTLSILAYSSASRLLKVTYSSAESSLQQLVLI